MSPQVPAALDTASLQHYRAADPKEDSLAVMLGKMGQRIVFGGTTIAFLLTIFALDASIGRWAGGTDPVLVKVLGPSPAKDPLTNLLYRGSIVPVVFLIALLRGTRELLGLFRATGIYPHSRLAYISVTATFLAPWLSAAGWLGAGVAPVEGLYWSVAFLAITALGCGIAQLSRGGPEGAMKDASATLFIVTYVGFLPSFALQIRSGTDSPDQQGVWLLLITLLVAKSSDIGAYFGGSAFGRHKLIPRISPGKSVEGTIAGGITSVLVAGLFAFLIPIASRMGTSPEAMLPLTEITGLFVAGADTSGSLALRALIFGLALSAAGQIGDLFESCFKRDVGIKDSGRIMPQFGGILDLIDSAIFALPVAWLLLTRVWHVA